MMTTTTKKARRRLMTVEARWLIPHGESVRVETEPTGAAYSEEEARAFVAEFGSQCRPGAKFWWGHICIS